MFHRRVFFVASRNRLLQHQEHYGQPHCVTRNVPCFPQHRTWRFLDSFAIIQQRNFISISATPLKIHINWSHTVHSTRVHDVYMKRDYAWVRPKIKQHKRQTVGDVTEGCICVTYAMAERYNMQALMVDILKDEKFFCGNLPNDFYNATHIGSKDPHVLADASFPGVLFVFREGSLSFWNIKQSVINVIMQLARKHSSDLYAINLIHWEREEMLYNYTTSAAKFSKGCFYLSSNYDANSVLEMFAFANALVVSVKLAHWEHSLDDLIDSIQSVPEELMKGNKLRTHTSDTVLRKIGEILLIRHKLNLQYNLLDVPDTYWDHENLEKLYTDTTRFLNINKRVKLMNEKLDYCAHMVELLKTHLHEKKSLRVELLIVLLIFIEIIFEIIHLFVLPYCETNTSQTQVNEVQHIKGR